MEQLRTIGILGALALVVAFFLIGMRSAAHLEYERPADAGVPTPLRTPSPAVASRGMPPADPGPARLVIGVGAPGERLEEALGRVGDGSDDVAATAASGLQQAWASGDLEEAAQWLRRIEAWAAGRCPCAGPVRAAPPPGVGASCEALCAADAALRPDLLARGHLTPADWRDGLRLAAGVCQERAPLQEPVEGTGRWADAWSWSGWPEGAWARCFASEADAPPHPPGPTDVALRVEPR